MNLTLRPEAERFIEEQVNSGIFPSPEAVVEAALAQLKDVDFELDDATLAAIREGDAQLERGEGVDFDQLRAQWKKRFLTRQ